MIYRQAQGKIIGVSHLAGFRTLGLKKDSSDPEDGNFGSVEHRRESLDSEHPQVCKSKGTAGKIIRRNRSRPAIAGKLLDRRGQVFNGKIGRVPNDRNQKAPWSIHGHAQVNFLEDGNPVTEKMSVHFGMRLQGFDDGVGD